MTRVPTLIFSTFIFACASAQADWAANVGWASDYYYRGILQKPSSVSAGIDFEHKGVYGGVWSADVGDGLEVDGYFGFGSEVRDFSFSVGFTGYYYTGDFDDTYQELNLSAGYGIVKVDVAIGEYDNFSGPTLDYTHSSLTLAKHGFYGTYGAFGEDFDGAYFVVGYATSVADFDLGLSVLFSDDDLVGDADEALIFTIGKTFDLN